MSWRHHHYLLQWGTALKNCPKAAVYIYYRLTINNPTWANTLNINININSAFRKIWNGTPKFMPENRWNWYIDCRISDGQPVLWKMCWCWAAGMYLSLCKQTLEKHGYKQSRQIIIGIQRFLQFDVKLVDIPGRKVGLIKLMGKIVDVGGLAGGLKDGCN